MQTYKNIDDYIQHQTRELQKSLEDLRHYVKTLVPDATECISYGVPTFKFNGKAFAGFGAYKKFLSFYPFGGQILQEFQSELAVFDCTKSAIHFTPEKPIPKELLKKVILRKLETIQ